MSSVLHTLMCPACHSRRVRALMATFDLQRLQCQRCGQLWSLPGGADAPAGQDTDVKNARMPARGLRRTGADGSV